MVERTQMTGWAHGGRALALILRRNPWLFFSLVALTMCVYVILALCGSDDIRHRYPAAIIHLMQGFQAENQLVSLPSKFLKPLSPLAPLNQRLLQADPPLQTAQITECLRRGIGLKAMYLPNGMKTWRENGVVYRPREILNHSESARLYRAEYEPYIPFNHSLFFEGRAHPPVSVAERKLIVVRLVGEKEGNITKPKILEACPDFPCLRTTDPVHLKSAAAFVVQFKSIMRPAPKERPPHQVYVMYLHGPALEYEVHNSFFRFAAHGWRHAFNWTMSYHLDADIFSPYGIVRPRPVPIVKDYRIIVAKKRDLAVVISSYCTSSGKRTKYIQELQKYMAVHVYGQCGPYRCYQAYDSLCIANFSRSVKFIFAFESAICLDYVSEKFFRMLQTDAVVVARGGNNYFKNVPPEIFINANDFRTPKELAERLLFLDKHDDEYVAILREKDKYFVSYQSGDFYLSQHLRLKYCWEAVPLCEICQRLWNAERYAKQYDIETWLEERQC